ncbi:hypothetical protein ARTHRO9AX_10129 [Arthrobacter sp. 9AX]|nr:hypothetical protein ARTHRO9AX_10129 [Arthrobacter sp. 9AX]
MAVLLRRDVQHQGALLRPGHRHPAGLPDGRLRTGHRGGHGRHQARRLGPDQHLHRGHLRRGSHLRADRQGILPDSHQAARPEVGSPGERCVPARLLHESPPFLPGTAGFSAIKLWHGREQAGRNALVVRYMCDRVAVLLEGLVAASIPCRADGVWSVLDATAVRSPAPRQGQI